MPKFYDHYVDIRFAYLYLFMDFLKRCNIAFTHIPNKTKLYVVMNNKHYLSVPFHIVSQKDSKNCIIAFKHKEMYDGKIGRFEEVSVTDMKDISCKFKMPIIVLLDHYCDIAVKEEFVNIFYYEDTIRI